MITAFEKFFGAFKETKMWEDMLAETENSPWHRESSVAEHTRMVLDHYIKNIAEKRSKREQAITLLSLLFHDVGKPQARREVVQEDGSVRRRYPNHEKLSARMWESYASSNWFRWKKLKYEFNLMDSDITLISWIIENHLPFKMKDAHFPRLADHLHSEMFEFGDLKQTYFDHLLSDQHGRIADNSEKNIAEVVEFISYVECVEPSHTVSKEYVVHKEGSGAPKLIVLVGASGSGKSTYSNELISRGYEYFSLDKCRIDYAVEAGIVARDPSTLYSKAYDYCGIHRGPFSKYADKTYESLIALKHDVIVDNTNVDFRARNKFIKHAVENGYFIKCVMFPLDIKKLMNRQKTRTDKTVPMAAVYDQYYRISVPWIGTENNECDKVETAIGNLD